MHIDISQLREWTEAAKTAAEALVAIVTAVKTVTAIMRGPKRKPRSAKSGRRRRR